MNKNDQEKGSNFLKSVTLKVGEASKKLVETVKDKSHEISEQNQIKNRNARMNRYNPLFPEKFKSEEFNLPNLIVIVDEAERRNIDVCEGAIGWTEKANGVEVLRLYDEAVGFSNLQFLPAPVCDSAYYVNPHDRTQFITVETFFSSMQEEKLAELQHIAYALGAKHYWVEMIEGSSEKNTAKTNASLSCGKDAASIAHTAENTNISKSQSLAEATFSGNRKPIQPTLCWFAHDKNVQNLIEMRCNKIKGGGITNYTIELNNSNAATMSESTAAKIDAATAKLKLKSACSFSKKSAEEHRRKLFFKLEF